MFLLPAGVEMLKIPTDLKHKLQGFNKWPTERGQGTCTTG